MELKFKVYVKIAHPIAEVFDAVYNPKKLSGYFTTGGSSGPLDSGATVNWDFADFPGAFPVNIKETIKNQKIVLQWASAVDESVLTVDFSFKALDAGSTLVEVSEWGWLHENQKALDESYSHCSGWMQMLCCLKMYEERGLNMREFFF